MEPNQDTTLVSELQEQIRKAMQTDPAFRINAYQMASADPVIVAALIKTLQNANAFQCSRAFEKLQMMSLDTGSLFFASIVRAFGGLLRYPNADIRLRAARAIVERGAAASRTDGMEAMLLQAVHNRSEDDAVRCWTIAALAPLARNKATHATLRELAANDDSAAVRAAAASILAETQSVLEPMQTAAARVAAAMKMTLEDAANWLRTMRQPATRIEDASSCITITSVPSSASPPVEISGKVSEILFQITADAQSGRRELTLATGDAALFNQVVVVKCHYRANALEGMEMETAPVYVLLKQLGIQASGEILLDPEIGEPTGIAVMPAEDFPLDAADSLRVSWQEQTRQFPETAPLWAKWIESLPDDVQNRIKENSDEH